MGVLLQICCIFSKHLFPGIPLGGCFHQYILEMLKKCIGSASLIALYVILENKIKQNKTKAVFRKYEIRLKRKSLQKIIILMEKEIHQTFERNFFRAILPFVSFWYRTGLYTSFFWKQKRENIQIKYSELWIYYWYFQFCVVNPSIRQHM